MLFSGAPANAYNLNDAGQFLWDNAMQRLGFSYSSAKVGSEGNEGFRDTKADQQAIRKGFHHTVGTSKINGGHFNGLPLNGEIRRRRF